MDNQLTVSSSPHIRADESTRAIMLDMLIALVFPLAVAVYFFGWRSLSLTAFTVTCCVVFEYLYRKLLKKPNSLGDLSAPVTGMLLSFTLPVSAPYWMAAVGAFFAIVVVKQLYGGLGKNFLNPALAARAFLAGFAALSVHVAPLSDPRVPILGSFDADAIAQATPLSYLKPVEQLRLDRLPEEFSWWENLFLGQIPGAIGEVSAAMLLLGGLYLVIRRVITPRIPLAFIGTVALLTFLFPRGGIGGYEYMLYNLLSGGLLLGAVFMATDYSTSPVTPRGQWAFGIGCGLLTVFFRYFSAMPEGVCFAILLMNTVVWLLDKIGAPRRFGRGWTRREG
ncbi:MAG: RnfABCDGE type electron transport complex subunit D [Oscillospiraceae bacterium]|jgi:electron transport complex protein RnfD|nr:RnfABCDGE type electron transport complex subunit D [Oscillospiraceae bacterium]